MLLFDYVTVMPNCLNDSLIDMYLSLKEQEVFPALTGYSDNQKTNLEYRKTNWIPIPYDLLQQTQASITSFYNGMLLDKYKQPIKFIEPTQLLHYPVGGEYKEHNDSEDFVHGKLTRVCERDLSILAYLNDDYEGGELELNNFNVTFKPKAGTVICFPSYIEFTHRVYPVTKGNRYTLATWICTYERIYSRPYL